MCQLRPLQHRRFHYHGQAIIRRAFPHGCDVGTADTEPYTVPAAAGWCLKADAAQLDLPDPQERPTLLLGAQ